MDNYGTIILGNVSAMRAMWFTNPWFVGLRPTRNLALIKNPHEVYTEIHKVMESFAKHGPVACPSI